MTARTLMCLLFSGLLPPASGASPARIPDNLPLDASAAIGLAETIPLRTDNQDERQMTISIKETLHARETPFTA
jgi:hypothetical protein